MTSLLHPYCAPDSRWRGTGTTRRFSRYRPPDSAAGRWQASLSGSPPPQRCQTRSCVPSSDTRSRRSPVLPAQIKRHVPAMPGTRTARHRHQQPGPHDGQLASAISRRRSPAVLPAPPSRRSRTQGRWSVARAPVTGWTVGDRGPQADAEERTRSVHRAIEIREKRRRVLSSRLVRITLRCSRR